MRVFLGWSGDQSQAVANALHSWLKNVIQALDPWMSDTDIRAGARWRDDLAKGLEDAKFGILCVTPENLDSIWLHFEAGALSKAVEADKTDVLVCPYLIGVEESQLTGPLSDFKAKTADREATLSIVKSINNLLEEGQLSEVQLKKTFDRWWPDLERQLESALKNTSVTPKEERPIKDMVKEILDRVRALGAPLESHQSFSYRFLTPHVQDEIPEDLVVPRSFVDAFLEKQVRKVVSEAQKEHAKRRRSRESGEDDDGVPSPA